MLRNSIFCASRFTIRNMNLVITPPADVSAHHGQRSLMSTKKQRFKKSQWVLIFSQKWLVMNASYQLTDWSGRRTLIVENRYGLSQQISCYKQMYVFDSLRTWPETWANHENVPNIQRFRQSLGVKGHVHALDSFRPNAAYMRQWNRPSLVQIMVWRLFDTKQLSEPMLAYCQLDHRE